MQPGLDMPVAAILGDEPPEEPDHRAEGLRPLSVGEGEVQELEQVGPDCHLGEIGADLARRTLGLRLDEVRQAIARAVLEHQV